MNASDFISSGILELYANGLTSPEENREVEAAIARYPEVAEELNAIREALATLASVNYQEGSPGLLDRIMDSIDEEEKRTPPAEDNIKPISGASRSDDWVRWVAIAASILLLVSLALNIIYFRQLSEAKGQIASLRASQSVMAQEIEGFKTTFRSLNDELAIHRNPDFRQIPMDGESPRDLIKKVNQADALATVYWNQESEEVFLFAQNLKAPPAGFQYQLWAIGDQGPVSVGVFDVNGQLQTLSEKISGNVSAFAVTLEQEGGSPTPNLPQMFVLGKV